MKLIKLTAFVFCICLVAISARYTEGEEQEEKSAKSAQVYPVSIPQNLSLAGEIVPLDKFEIKERLDRELLVNTYWQSNMMLILKRTQRAFKVITPILKANGVPEDFKYLAVAESGLVNVVSPAGAKGIWQFMPKSGKEYGLMVDQNVDERYNLEKSTEAACGYLKEAYAHFGSWSLAAAAYNRGMNGIRRDLAKQHVSTYYDLHLNPETSRYLLRILALKIIIENPEQYGFHIEEKDYYATEKTQDITVDSTIANISDYAQTLGTNYHVIKSLNPWMKSNNLIVNKTHFIIKAPLNE